MEIEKKYLVAMNQTSDWYPHATKVIHIDQYYLNDMDDQWLIRLRQSGSQYFLALKGKGLLFREELEFQITKIE